MSENDEAPKVERVYVGHDEDEAQVLRDLFALLGEERDQRAIVWVPGDRAVDVPADVYEAYTKKVTAAAKKTATKAAKTAKPPAETKQEE